MSDNASFFTDSKPVFTIVDLPSISPLSTAVPLYTAGMFPPLGNNYFGVAGKSLNIRMFGRMTSAVTPGNFSIAVYFGTGAATNGVLLASSLATAWQASQSNMSWWLDLDVVTRTVGSAGTLFCTGIFHANVLAILSTAQPLLIPSTAPVVSGACDLTTANIISVQAIRSGSTAETMIVHQMRVNATWS